MDRLLVLQQRITHRIEQAKNQIHPTHNKAFIDSVLIEIDTLNWVLNEIVLIKKTRYLAGFLNHEQDWYDNCMNLQKLVRSPVEFLISNAIVIR
jgi:hypothetical protein